ncbi:MAG: hypothetical protein WDZ76_08340 [Pseudohongiellaceae bacterium]
MSLRKLQLWIALGVVGAVSTTCTHMNPEPADDRQHTMAPATAGGAGDGGEGGGGGEGGEPAGADAVTSDAAYRVQLGLIRGHLLVGVGLYREGQQIASETHMKHPEDELYAALLPALQARNAPGFGEELQQLAQAVENGAPPDRVESAYQNLLNVIDRAENAAAEPDAAQLGEVIATLVRVAADEYVIARAADGSVANAHEYQDAMGFVQVAGQLAQRLETLSNNVEAITTIRNQLADIASIWPGLTPPARLSTEPAVLYGTAARIEIASLSL